MKLLFQLTFIVVLLSNNIVYADTLDSTKLAKTLCNEVMEQIAKNNLDEAFNLIKPYAAFSETEIDSVAVETKAQREQVSKRYGISNAYEFINSKQVGRSLLRLRYIEKMEKHVIVWSFYFYKTDKGWVLNTFDWKDQFENLFNEDANDNWWN